jgi:hypothetical protein
MNPWLQIPGQPPGKFRVGQKVRMKHLFRGQVAEVIEDRGPIGYRGRRLYTVRLQLDPWNDYTSELPEESLEAIEDATDSSPPPEGEG